MAGDEAGRRQEGALAHVSPLPKEKAVGVHGASSKKQPGEEAPPFPKGGSVPRGQGSFVTVAEPGCFSHGSQTAGDASPGSELRGTTLQGRGAAVLAVLPGRG